MPIKDVASKVDFVKMEQETLAFWKESEAFNKLRLLRKGAKEHWSFVDGPITANNPMGVHHAWGRTYKDLYNRYHAMLGKELRWQQGFDCQGLWVEVNVEKDLGFQSKRDIEAYGLAEFIKLCKMRVLEFAAVQTAQSVRLGYWMDWNNLEELESLRRALAEDDQQTVTIQGPQGSVTGTAEQVVGQLGMPHVGGSYFTFSDENNYQIWRFIKTVEERGWLYKGTDVMPWCARCGTGISQHEIVTDGYKDTTHESVYVKFPLLGRGEQEALLVWTTTPWTLSSNVAAAVGPELIYAQVRHNDGWTYYLAKEAMKSSLIGKEGTDYEVVAELKGSEMLGWHYAGPFDELTAAQTAFAEANYTHRVISWKDVGAAEGTGIVHIAPGCGAEDFGLSKEHLLPVVAPLDENGIYGEGFGWLSGRSVMESGLAEEIFADLRGKGAFYRKQKYTHRYPHCWRCGTELVYRLVDEWFISMGELYDKPREEVTAEEKAASLRYQIMDSVDQANWYPSFGYDREMDWLRNMHDWMISKKRYWGLALPIWVFPDGSYYVVGSQEELRELAVEGWETFEGHTPHRPYIDAVKIRHPHKPGMVGERIKDVGNPWLDAGIVAISTLHASSDPEYWAKWYPADWISESFPGQFRNWFYSLLAQSTVLTGRSPFKNLFSYATLLAEDGRAMHKSWGNSIEFNQAADQMGADTMRWLYASCKPEKDLRFGFAVGDETRRRFLIPLWNVYSFFTTYASLDGWEPSAGARPTSPDAGNAQMDEWILARLDETALAMRAALDIYNAERATQLAEAFLDELSNWYVRRSRRRFWRSEADADKSAAYATLHHVLVEYSKLLAPFIPFTTEVIYQNLVRGVDASAPESIHHTAYPTADPATLNSRLLAKMQLAITTASLGRAARSSADVKLRQPLATARVNVGSQQEEEDLRELAEVLAEEMNVKAIEIVSEVGELVSYKLLPNNAVLGPKFGKLFPKIRQALLAVDPAAGARLLQAGQPISLTVDGEAVELNGEDVLVQTEARGEAAVASERGITVAVDTHLTEALLQEGYARDLVRLINNLRKETGLEISDRVELVYSGAGLAAETLTNFAAYIQAETLATHLGAGDPQGATAVLETAVGDAAVVIGLTKVG
ncbi:MAG: isoleucine--tRNA ligase [Chloroflexi bacterium]|nr:isoleucine--tRNA ligase [Chloroflexota bacterium]